MNDTLRLLLSHTSVRRFQKEKLTDSQKDQLLLAAQSGSSSNFLQAYSILEISDPIPDFDS